MKSNSHVNLKESNVKSTSNHINPGVSIRNGPILDDKNRPVHANGTSKAKRKASTQQNYKESSDSEDEDMPLVSSFSLCVVK